MGTFKHSFSVSRRLCANRPAVLSPLLLSSVLTAIGWAQPPVPPERRPSQPLTAEEAEQARALEKAVGRAIEQCQRSVVAIIRVPKAERGGTLGPGGVPQTAVSDRAQPGLAYDVREYGMGVVLDRSGKILTNHHVLGDPRANDYYVSSGGKTWKVHRVLAADPWMDLAVLDLVSEDQPANASDWVPIELGEGESIRRGQFVVALGDPLAVVRDGEPTSSWGIISHTDRKTPRLGTARDGLDTVHHFGSLLQSDARFSLGSSGGALIDLDGRMIGLTSMWVAALGDAQAGGFAIPVDEDFRRVVKMLSRGELPEYGFLGVVPAAPPDDENRDGQAGDGQAGDGDNRANVRGPDVDRANSDTKADSKADPQVSGPDETNGDNLERLASPRRAGVVIQSIIPHTPADDANFLLDDVILAIDGQSVFAADDLSRIIGKKNAGATIQIQLDRRGREVLKEVVLAKRYLNSRRRPYSITPPRVWRGMIVDQPTAVPSLIGRAHAIDPEGCVGVVDVTPDSPAWLAGMRPGDFIRSVDGERVVSVAEFYRFAMRDAGPVELVVTDGARRGTSRQVPAETR